MTSLAVCKAQLVARQQAGRSLWSPLVAAWPGPLQHLLAYRELALSPQTSTNVLQPTRCKQLTMRSVQTMTIV
jgi:hypothetical protein